MASSGKIKDLMERLAAAKAEDDERDRIVTYLRRRAMHAEKLQGSAARVLARAAGEIEEGLHRRPVLTNPELWR